VAVLWSRRVGDTLYEVRSAGATRRLYTNGVLHSQYNPKQPVTGSVWDLLMLPAFFTDPARLRRILVLGVGGGAVLRQLRAFVDPEELVGVDIEKVHLSVARRHFGLTPRVATLVHADARQWLEGYAGPPFDMIIDDLFGHVDGEPERAIAMDIGWARMLLSHLAADGILVANFPDRRTLKDSALVANRRLRNGFATRYIFSTPMNENAVAAWLRFPATRQKLRERLSAVPVLDANRRSCRLRFQMNEDKE